MRPSFRPEVLVYPKDPSFSFEENQGMQVVQG